MGSSVVRAELATHARVCSHDRMGVGWSDRGPDVTSIGALADDLRRLQDAAALEPPFVIVALSIGGLVAEMFARRYPERVAGPALLDPATAEVAAQRVEWLHRSPRVQSVPRPGWRGVGAIRMLDPFEIRHSEADAAARAAALTYGAQPWVAICALVRGVRTTLEEFERAPSLRPDMPLRVLTAERTDGIGLPPSRDT